MPHTRPWRRTTMIAAVAASVCTVVAACSSGGGAAKTSSPPPTTGTSTTASASPSPSTAPAKQGGVATFAEGANAKPNWIFPFMNLAFFSVTNIPQFQQLMYRPLYYFGGENGQPTVDYGLSVANAPVYQDNGKTVVLNLKGWKWSNGETVGADDVMFWMNMIKAEKKNWAAYVPGNFPDNVVSVTKSGPDQVTMKLNGNYSSLWFTYNELSQVTPMPLAWDKTSDSAAAGSGGCHVDVSKCAAVYTYLTNKSKDLKSYATDPLWQVVDGPWKLSQFSADGTVTFVPNSAYSGSPKPTLSEFKELPFTSDSAEFNVLKSGNTINVGYIPSQDLPQKPANAEVPPTNPAGSSYDLKPAYGWSFNYFVENFNNPTVGPIFQQLYFRQAFEMLVNQEVDVQKAERGYGYPTTGPVPVRPDNKWIPPIQKGAGPYPFDTAKAKSLLESHGWSMQGKTMACTKPGSSAGECGAGVKAGQKLDFNLEYYNGALTTKQQMLELQSDAAKAGVTLNLTGAPFDTVIGHAVPCKPTDKACTWQLENWGGGWIYSPDYLPTGGELFGTGAGSNSGSYTNKTMDALIAKSHSSSNIQDFYNYATFAAKDLPVVYDANGYGIDAVSKNLQGVVFNPLETLLPEYWSFTQ